VQATTRRIGADEWELLRDLRLRALADAPYAFAETLGDALQLPGREWQSRAASNSEGNDSTCLLAFDGRFAVGMAACAFGGGGSAPAYLGAMWVAKEYRGLGVAASLLNGIAEWARAAGANRLDAGVAKGNTRAKRFYEKRGFRDAGMRTLDAPHLKGSEYAMVMRLD